MKVRRPRLRGGRRPQEALDRPQALVRRRSPRRLNVWTAAATLLLLALPAIPASLPTSLPVSADATPTGAHGNAPGSSASGLGFSNRLGPDAGAASNSSPVPEIGTSVALVPVGSGPASVLFDPNTRLAYVANEVSSSVSILDGTSVAATLSTGGGPYSMALDPLDGSVFIGSTGSPNITVLRGTQAIATIVTAFPVSALAFDPATTFLYAASATGSSVEVIESGLVVGAAQVGATPIAVALDGSNGYLYVANRDSANVSVLNGSTLVATVAVGSFPEAVAYDPANRLVYVANFVSSSVSVIDGTTLLANIAVGAGPIGLLADPRTGWVYVSEGTNGSVGVLSGLSKRAEFAVGSGPYRATFDPMNGNVYVAEVGNRSLRAIHGTTVLGAVAVGSEPTGIAVDPANGNLYVADYGINNVSVVSTLLAEGPIRVAPPGDPAPSGDVGQTFALNATLWAIGSGTDSVRAHVEPSAGLGCAGPVASRTRSATVEISLSCSPNAAGNYTAWLNASDTLGARVWSTTPVRVFASPLATRIRASVGPISDAHSADIGQSVRFSETPLAGTGLYLSYRWAGLPTTQCWGLDTRAPGCTFDSPTTLTLGVAVGDSNGAWATSAPLTFPILRLPLVKPPIANRTSADVGQAVSFSAASSYGSGAYQYEWLGLPVTCDTGRRSNVSCVMPAPGSVEAQVTAIDSNGGRSALSAPVVVSVFPDPTATAPVVSAPEIRTGEHVSLEVSAAGGSGGYTYAWRGMPTACGVAGPEASCWPNETGRFLVSVEVTDTNGFSVLSNATALRVVAPAPSGAGLLGVLVAGLVGASLAGLLVAVVFYRRRRRRRSPNVPLGGEPAR